MTTELNRDAPLYEAELPVRLVGEDAAVVEGERQLTIRLLEGTRPLGQTETPVPNSSDGAAGRERLLHLEVADAQDPYFLYALAVGEGDFHAMRREHALLVDFAAFPQHFVDLLKRCEGPQRGESTFCAALERPWRGAAKFAVVEANAFKQVEHVGLGVVQGDDHMLKAYLAGRLAQALLDGRRSVQALQEASLKRDSNGDEVQQLMSEKEALEDQLREHAASAAAQLREAEATYKSREADAVAQARKIAADELRAERDRSSQQADAARTALFDARERADAAEIRSREAEATSAQARSALEATKVRVEATDSENARVAEALRVAEAERDGAVATSRGLEIRLAALEQRAENAEDTVKRADAARKLADEASQRDADLREDLKRRLENREQQLQAAAAEITRGNAIIERLSEQARAQQQKLRLRADVVKQQERRVADARRDLDSAKHEKELAVADSRREQDKRQQAEKDLEQANKKLDEAADLLEHNQRVIQWLNSELHEHQVGSRKTAMPSVVSPGDVTATKDLTGESAPDDSVDAAADYFAKYGGVSSEADTASSAKDSSFLGRSGSGSQSFLREPGDRAGEDYAQAPAAFF